MRDSVIFDESLIGIGYIIRRDSCLAVFPHFSPERRVKCRRGILCRGHQESSETAILKPISSSESVTRSCPDSLRVQDQRRSRRHSYSEAHSAKPPVFFKNSSNHHFLPQIHLRNSYLPLPHQYLPAPSPRPRLRTLHTPNLGLLLRSARSFSRTSSRVGFHASFTTSSRGTRYQSARSRMRNTVTPKAMAMIKVCFAVAGLQLEED